MSVIQPRFAIFGAGGNGRELAAVLDARHGGQADIVFVTDDGGPEVAGRPHLGFDAMKAQAGERLMVVSVARPDVRRQIVERCEAAGFGFAEVRAKSCVDYGADIAEGAVLCDFTLLTVNVRIGRHFHANYYSQVSHDCVIGDFVTFGPGVRCNGNVTIEDEAYIGAGATIRQGLRIGRGAVVGMGAAVVADVPAGALVKGVPAR